MPANSDIEGIRPADAISASPMPAFGVTDANATPRAGLDYNRFRRSRVRQLVAHIERYLGKQDRIRILDVGGVRGFWQGMEDLWQHLPLDITLLNLGATPQDYGAICVRSGNACAIDAPDQSYDLVHSNSVIEHVGHWDAMRAMAREVRRLAPHLWVQTPNFWFPVEPHYRAVGWQWWPETVRATMLLRRKRGFHGRAADIDQAMEAVQSVNLLSARQMSALFPDCQIKHERFLGLSKSLIAVR